MIRQARPEDEEAVRRCAEAAFSGYVPLIGRRPAPMDADLRTEIAAGEMRVFDDGGVLGYIVFRPDGDAMLLDAVGVSPAAQGRGVGRALIAACEAEAAAQGLADVRLYTNARMTGNLTLYPRLGYREVDRRTENGFDRVYFVKTMGG